MVPVFISSPTTQVLFWVAYSVWMVPEVVGMFTQRSRGGVQNRDRGSFILLLVMLWLGIFFAFFFAFGVHAAMITWHSHAWFYAGVFLMVAGVLFRWHAIRVLGGSFTRDVVTRPGQTVVQAGLYRYIRHPAYTGTLLTMFGLGFALGNWLSLLTTLAGWAIGHIYRVSVEEKALENDLGQPYIEYERRTKRFIPFIL